MALSREAVKTIEGVGLFLGMLIGAGMFALPYSFYRGGFYWSLGLFAVVFLISLLLHYLYAGIVEATPGKHRFGGYARRYLGKKAEKIAFLFTFISFEGALLAYGVLGGTFLNIIFGVSILKGGIIFLAAGGLLFLLSLDFIGKVDFYLSLLLFCFVFFLDFKLIPSIEMKNIFQSGANDYFLPYGIFLFSLGAYSAIPDIKDVLGINSSRVLKKIIFWGLSCGAFFYLLFSVPILGVLGPRVSEDAFLGLGLVLGKGIVSFGAAIGLLAIFRTYLGLGEDLKLTFKYDFGFPEILSWLLAFSPSFVLFSLGFSNLISILRFVGSVGLGIFAFFIILMAWKIRDEVSEFLGFGVKLWWVLPLGLLIIAGALQDILVLILN